MPFHDTVYGIRRPYQLRIETDGEKYIINSDPKYQEATEAALLDQARNPDSSFDMFDAAVTIFLSRKDPLK